MKRWMAPAAIAGVLSFAFFVTWRCPIAAVTGHPCPGCGLTRAARLVLAGDFAAATAAHPLVWLVGPVVAGFLVVEIVGYARTKAWGASMRVRGAMAVMVGTAVLMFAVWVARFFGALGGPVAV
jgi:hypothetical protein